MWDDPVLLVAAPFAILVAWLCVRAVCVAASSRLFASPLADAQQATTAWSRLSNISSRFDFSSLPPHVFVLVISSLRANVARAVVTPAASLLQAIQRSISGWLMVWEGQDELSAQPTLRAKAGQLLTVAGLVLSVVDWSRAALEIRVPFGDAHSVVAGKPSGRITAPQGAGLVTTFLQLEKPATVFDPVTWRQFMTLLLAAWHGAGGATNAQACAAGMFGDFANVIMFATATAGGGDSSCVLTFFVAKAAGNVAVLRFSDAGLSTISAFIDSLIASVRETPIATQAAVAAASMRSFLAAHDAADAVVEPSSARSDDGAGAVDAPLLPSAGAASRSRRRSPSVAARDRPRSPTSNSRQPGRAALAQRSQPLAGAEAASGTRKRSLSVTRPATSVGDDINDDAVPRLQLASAPGMDSSGAIAAAARRGFEQLQAGMRSSLSVCMDEGLEMDWQQTGFGRYVRANVFMLVPRPAASAVVA